MAYTLIYSIELIMALNKLYQVIIKFFLMIYSSTMIYLFFIIVNGLHFFDTPFINQLYK